MLFLHVTSQVTTDPHQGLLREKGFGGFPSLAFMDADGNVVAKQGDRSVAGFQTTLNRLAKVKELSGKTDDGSFVELTFAKVDLGSLKASEAKTQLTGKTLSKDQSAKLESLMLDEEIMTLRSSAKSREDMDAVGAKLVEMKKAGRIPTGSTVATFWQTIASHAESKKDAPLFEEAFTALKKSWGTDERYKRAIDSMETRLKAMKDGKSQPEKQTTRLDGG